MYGIFKLTNKKNKHSQQSKEEQEEVGTGYSLKTFKSEKIIFLAVLLVTRNYFSFKNIFY